MPIRVHPDAVSETERVLWSSEDSLGWQVARVQSRYKGLRPWRLLLSLVMLFCCAAVGRSQTSVIISNAVETPGIDRPGINLGGLGGYGSQQIFKSLNYVNGGDFPGTYAATTYPCKGGTNTSWYNDITNANGYPANFWAGASFTAINASNGTSYGSGVITASSSNTQSGTTFTLSPAISSPCNPSQNDVLIVRLTSPTTQLTPYQVLNNHICPEASWVAGDTSPSSSNTQHSLEMPNGCGLTFYIDATVSNRTNTNPSLASQQVNFININGSYNATFKAKCLGGGCSVNFSLLRFGGTTFVGNTTVNPSTGGPGAGWTTYNYPFTASENGNQNGSIGYSFSCSGTCLLQDADVIEGSTLPGNTTVFRDGVVAELQKLHPGSIRYMDSSQWCSDVADEIAATGNRRWCGSSDYGPGAGQPIGYADVLALANFIGSDVFISVGQLNQPSDWAMLIKWLSSSGWTSTYAAAGHTIYLEDGNEAWNSGVGATLYFGNGTAYGYTLGPNMAAAKAASGYNSSVIKLVGDGWVAGSQGYGPFGWLHNALSVAQGTPNGLPDFVDDAPYTLNYLRNFDTSGGNVATTGAPFVDEFAEIANIDSVPIPALYTESMFLNELYAKANYGVNTLVYEVNLSTLSGVPANELQLDQVGASVGSALAISEHVLLMQRDSMVSGPIHVFTLAEPYTGYSCNGCGGGSVIPLWGTNLYMATGPGQAAGSANADRPLNIALSVIDNAIGSNNNLMSIAQIGTPTYNYPGGQRQGSSNSISPNPAVPYVNCFSYSNGASAWTTICFNNNLTATESVTLAGAGAPVGSVSETVFPGPSNVITDHNENTFLGAGSIAPVVSYPNATTTSGTHYSIPPASFIALTYTTGGVPAQPTLGTPTFSLGTGSYTGTQTVGISFPAGSTGCVGINSLPTAGSPGTCGPGGTAYTSPITVSASETVNAIATQAGSINSAPATATYTLTTVTTAAAPTFSPAGGTYTTPQSVSIGDATPGTTIHYTTNGTTPTTSSSVYAGAITVPASETLEAIAVKSGYTTSAAATAAYTINSVTTGGGTPSVSTSCYQGSGASSLTTGPVNTTGASAIAIVVGSFNNILTVTDNLGNGNAIGLPAANGGSPNNQIFYWQNPTVGSEQTFTVKGSGGLFASACVFVMSGVSGTYSGAQGANSAGYGSSSCQTGITPASGPQVIIAGFGVYAPSGVPTLDSGYTLGAYQAGAGGVAFGEAAGYLIQPAGAATSPNWNWSSGASSPGCVIAAFGGGSGVVTNTAATPTFSPGAGSYTTPQSVSIGDATPGTTIHYTTNGTPPTTSSSIYGGPITVSSTETLAAIAVEAGYTTSPSNAAIYTISPILAAPTFSPGGGTYTTAQTVSLGDATPGTTIYYTSNGVAPTTSSSVYSGPITVSASETLQAIAVKSGFTSSAASLSAYAINTVITGGGAPSVSTSCYQGSAASSLTTGPINTTGANAIAVVVASFNNILTVTDSMDNGNAIGLPAANGNSPNNQIFYWQNPTVGASHTFTINGSGGLYASACVFVMSGVSGTYSGAHSASTVGYQSSTCQAGDITPGSGPQIVIAGFGVYTPSGAPSIGSGYTVAASQPGAGGTAFGEAAGYLIQPSGAATNPSWNWSNAASTPSCVIAAFGGGTGGGTTPAAATPTFSIAGGTYTTPQSVTISDATPGTTIYYTTDRTPPTTSSSVYGGAITVPASETLRAIAVESGYTTSPVASAAYTINAVTSGGSSLIKLAIGQFATSSFFLNGGATVTPDGVLQVVDGGYGEGRSAWFNTQVPVGKFTTDFTFQMPYANGDGMTFTIQGQGSSALGGSGAYLGYAGIGSSVAVKFDLYDNAGEGIDSTGLYTGGATPTVPAIDLSKTGIDLHSGHIMAAHLVYDGTNLTMTLTDVVTAASVVEVFPVNIPAAVGGSTAYVGFTGGTGGVASIQNLLTWSYSTNQ